MPLAGRHAGLGPRWVSGLTAAMLTLAALILSGGGVAPEPEPDLEPWPYTSRLPLAPLERPTVADRAASLEIDPLRGFRFAVIGDQRALADGEWQVMLERLDETAREESLLFLLDTGDIVLDGRHSDQFHVLASVLERVEGLPYLAVAGNHETSNNAVPRSREHLARFLAPLDDALDADRLWYRRDVGPLRLLFLDTNDWVYGEHGRRDEPGERLEGERSRRQWAWLVQELGRAVGDRVPLLAVVMHHPFVQSSKKHHEQARGLWSLTHDGRSLPDLLADGGVDLVLTGHTHTYERFRLTRADGRSFALVNLSGRPRPSFLWFGAGARSARDLAGREREWLSARGWKNLEDWTIRQEEAMLEPERNQFAVFTVDEDGGLRLRVHFTGRRASDEVRTGDLVRLH